MPDKPSTPSTAAPLPATAAPASASAAPAVPAPTTAAVAPLPAATRWLPVAGFAGVALLGAAVTLFAWRLPPFDDAVVSTENALVRGRVTVIGTQLPGYVTAVLANDFATVRAGQLLATIDERSYRQRWHQAGAQLAAQQAIMANWPQQMASADAGVALAQAALASAQAQQTKALADLARVRELAGDGSLSVRERDAASAAAAQAQAAVAQAQASVAIARANRQAVVVNRSGYAAAIANASAALQAAAVDLDNTRIVAPADGQLGQVMVRRGAYVNTGAALMALVPTQLWVIANFKETQMGRVRAGQAATFRVDALDGALLKGSVETISPATGAEFSVLPADNATGNYVKIAQRIPVRIRIAPGQAAAARLGPGMSVVATVDTASGGGSAP